MDNGPARNDSHAQQLQIAGEELGDMFEISTIRKADIAFHRGESVGLVTVCSCNSSHYVGVLVCCQRL